MSAPDWGRRTPVTVVRRVIHRVLFGPLLHTVLKISVHSSPELAGMTGPVVIVANHASHLDTPLVLLSLPRGLRRVAVGAAADYFFTTRLRILATTLLVNAFPVGRIQGDKRPGLAGSLVDEGWSLLLFPEATRSPGGHPGRFQVGPAKLSITKRIACVPVGLTGTFEAMPKGTRWPRSGRPSVTIRYGSPLWAGEGESADEFINRIREAVLECAGGTAVDQRRGQPDEPDTALA